MKIAMDDFGTGYSSLSYLRDFPFDILKIDQTFISGIAKNKKDAELIIAAIAMGHGLNIKIVAEGVESRDQFHFLKEFNCDYAQGYLFSKPISKSEFSKLIEGST